MTETTTSLRTSARHLLSDEGFERVVQLVTRDNDGIASAMAEQIVDEALKFVAAAARSERRTDVKLRPSRTVDVGWHALVLHTELYGELCSVLGGFVHHRPEGPATLRPDAPLEPTLAAIREAGFEPDAWLWGGSGDTKMEVGECRHSECTEGGSGCAAPEPGPA